MTGQLDIWKHCLELAQISDVGMRRANNQDSCVVVLASDEADFRQRGHFFMVADGMGAHAAGELASKIATDNISHTYRKLVGTPPPEALRKTILDANRIIHERGQGDDDFRGMGTTCSVLVLTDQGAVAAHVGDSRIYRLRNNRLDQLTFDHSLIWEAMSSGQVGENEVPDYVPKNVITRSLGPNPEVKVDLEGPFPLESGDTFLLCSDGLSGPVADEEIGIILSCLPVEDAVQTLVDLANLRGGPDNITVVACRVLGRQIPKSQPAPKEPDSPQRRPVHPALWIVMALCLLGGGGLVYLQYNVVLVALLLLAGLIAGGIGVVQLLDNRTSLSSHTIRGPLGRGPHRSYEIKATKAIAARFQDTVARLLAAAKKDGWQIDWPTFNTLRREADTAAAAGDYSTAIAQCGKSIRFIMSQLRSLREKTI